MCALDGWINVGYTCSLEKKGGRHMDWNSIVIEPVRAMMVRAATFLPTLVGILVILIIGWIIAAVLKAWL